MYIENFKFPTTFAFPLGSNLKIPAKHLGAVSYISFTKKKLLQLKTLYRKILSKLKMKILQKNYSAKIYSFQPLK